MEWQGEYCRDQICVTCSDEAVPVRVVQLLDDGLALVDTMPPEGIGVRTSFAAERRAGIEEISVALVNAVVGDTVLVHAKEAIAVVRGEP
jgi:hypothetical protein